jgi:hypothetical protein
MVRLHHPPSRRDSSFALYVADVNRGVGFRGTTFEPFASSFDLLERNCV